MKNRLLLLLLCVAGAWIAVRAACDGTGSESTFIQCGSSCEEKYPTPGWGQGDYTCSVTDHSKCAPGRYCSKYYNNSNGCVACWQKDSSGNKINRNGTYTCTIWKKDRSNQNVIAESTQITGAKWMDCFNLAADLGILTARIWSIEDNSKTAGSKTVCGNCNWAGCGPCTIAN